MNDLISRQALCEYALNQKDRSVTPNDIMRFPSAQPDNQTNLCNSCDYSFPDCPSKNGDVIFGNGIGNDNICACNKYKPSAQPDLSAYSDKLWRAAYERGKREAQPEIIRCMDCKHSEYWYRDKCRCFLWHEAGIDVFDDGFCNYAERRQDG